MASGMQCPPDPTTKNCPTIEALDAPLDPLDDLPFCAPFPAEEEEEEEEEEEGVVNDAPGGAMDAPSGT